MFGYSKWHPVLTLLLFAGIWTGGLDKATQDALKVKHLLKTIETESERERAGERGNRRAEISERELNAYIVYRLALEEDPVIQNLTLVHLGGNRIRGNIRLNLGGVEFLVLLGTNLDFDFDAKLYTRNGMGRLDLTSLSLSGQPVDPQVLNLVLNAIARYYEVETGTIEDWYRLPHGIRRIEIKKAKAVLFY